ncbi:MAG: plasmid stabilization protein [Armatimonadetes bacterium]|nr:plasmid stabilization protein [Armatimonadota bacterium]
MASLTIRRVDEETKQTLRLRAARHGVSMEEEVRRILNDALAPARAPSRLGHRLLGRFAGLADDELALPERQKPRHAPQWDEPV